MADLPHIRIRSLHKEQDDAGGEPGSLTVKVEVDLLNWSDDVEAELKRLIETQAIIVIGGVPKDSMDEPHEFKDVRGLKSTAAVCYCGRSPGHALHDVPKDT